MSFTITDRPNEALAAQVDAADTSGLQANRDYFHDLWRNDVASAQRLASGPVRLL